jgi:acetyl-CoA acyltransferase
MAKKTTTSSRPSKPPASAPSASSHARAGSANGNGGAPRIAIVQGLRTPFAKQSTAYKSLSAQDLGRAVVSELVQRCGIDPKEIDMLVYGQVVPSVSAPNIAREIVLGTGLPMDIQAWSVSRACATSYQSLTSAAEAILAGQGTVAITGGADSSSDVPITVSKNLTAALIDLQKARTLGDRLEILSKLRPGDLVPVPPALKEPTTGLTMGESAEKMAKENRISREAQDEFAHRSHSLAAKAWAEGRFADEVMTLLVPPRYADSIAEDNLVRKDSALESYAKLKPVFDRKYGSVTAGNSSPLTDGASALLVMREDKAKALGYEPLGYLKSWAYAALDPSGQLLMGPAYAVPKALDRAGVKLRDMDLVDLHEAFAAAVLSQLEGLGSKKFAEEKLGRSEAVGEVPDEKLNVLGGSIAIGHPFAATGARQITQTLRELKRRGGGLALCAACAAGGLGAAVVLEGA